MDTIRHIGADVEVVGNVLELNGHRERGGQFRLARNGDPECKGNQKRYKFPPEISRQELHHGRYSRTACELCVTAGELRMLRRSNFPVRKSETSSILTSSNISPNAATEILPVSETITARQSDSSVMPSPARWRVPSSVMRWVLAVSGRKQAAAAMRSP